MAWSEGLASAYQACEALARSHYENFPVASRLLPSAMRPHVAALYAFARIADDIADEGTDPAGVRQDRLRAWQHRLHDAAEGRGTGRQHAASRDDLVFIALGHSIRTLGLPVSLFDDLLSAFGQDTTASRYLSWADVLDYCRRSANPIGRLVLRIAGHADPMLDTSSDALCTALQLTNFWQDFGRDWRAGRLYVPRDVQDECGARESDLGAETLTPAWARALEVSARLTRAKFEEGRAVCDGVRGRLRFELRMTWLGGLRILDRVEHMPFDLLRQRPTLGARDMAPILWRAVRVGKRRSLMARKTSFYYSFLVLPREQRVAIISVWDFCRAVDDAVDEAVGDSRAALEMWRAELARCFDAREPETPQGRQLKPAIQAFGLPRQPFEDVIDGVAMDLDTTRYQTFDELSQYCRRVASAVGLICIRIFGCRGETAVDYAVNLGLALQLTNILRDVGDDLRKGRVYLPLDDLAAAGCTVEDLGIGVVTAPVRRLMAFECARARDFYERAIAARPAADRKRLVAAEIMRAVYFETLQRIERSGYDVFSGGARVPRPRQALIALRQWLWPA